jgi:hypothetical protein
VGNLEVVEEEVKESLTTHQHRLFCSLAFSSMLVFEYKANESFSSWRVRAAPDVRSPEIGTIQQGQQFTVSEIQGDWLCVKVQYSPVAYVQGWSLSVLDGQRYLFPVDIADPSADDPSPPLL